MRRLIYVCAAFILLAMSSGTAEARWYPGKRLVERFQSRHSGSCGTAFSVSSSSGGCANGTCPLK
jgi:hypothetical protein